MPDPSRIQRDEILRALLGRPEHLHHFHTNAEFRAKVLNLAILLPDWIAGFALTAQDQENLFNTERERAMREAPVVNLTNLSDEEFRRIMRAGAPPE